MNPEGSRNESERNRSKRRKRRFSQAEPASPGCIRLVPLLVVDCPQYTNHARAGFYTHKMNAQQYPRLQLRTVKELMEVKGIERPSNAAAVDETFKKAPKAKRKGHEETGLAL